MPRLMSPRSNTTGNLYAINYRSECYDDLPRDLIVNLALHCQNQAVCSLRVAMISRRVLLFFPPANDGLIHGSSRQKIPHPSWPTNNTHGRIHWARLPGEAILTPGPVGPSAMMSTMRAVAQSLHLFL